MSELLQRESPGPRGPPKEFPCLGAPAERVPYQIADFSEETLSQSSPKGGALGTGFPTETINLDEESRNTLGEALPGLPNAVLS